MDDELDEFIRRHKLRVAADKARLEEPPYLEIKVQLGCSLLKHLTLHLSIKTLF
uniref:Uncharacterized protein n=1 Tax=Nothobranchius furzeri TaxID=105023 RepID=A0A8C6K6T7_NOTFU